MDQSFYIWSNLPPCPKKPPASLYSFACWEGLKNSWSIIFICQMKHETVYVEEECSDLSVMASEETLCSRHDSRYLWNCSDLFLWLQALSADLFSLLSSNLIKESSVRMAYQTLDEVAAILYSNPFLIKAFFLAITREEYSSRLAY